MAVGEGWPFIFKACAVGLSLAAAVLLIWLNVNYWSSFIGWAVLAVDLVVVAGYFIWAGHRHTPEDPP